MRYMSCISVNGLSKYYGSFQALDAISFDVEYEKVFGLLGPNGAGKTTLIKILTTLIKPSAGKVKVLGYDLLREAFMIRSRIGVVQQKPSLDSNISVKRSLDVYGMLWNIPRHVRSDRIETLLDIFGLREVSNTKVDDLSIGQKRRLQVAREFMHDMDLLFLDEPTVGMDPSARRVLLDYIKKRVREGLTVFYTTHIMEEAEYLCDEIAIINRGRLIALDSPQTLKSKYGGIKKVEIRLKGQLNGIKDMLNDDVEIYNNSIRIVSNNAEEILTEIMHRLIRNNIQIESLSVTPPTLEDIFLSIIER